VFVCQGNICRSAYAEARARASGIATTSFGLCARGGDKPPPPMLQTAAEVGLDLADHCSRAAAAVCLDSSDLVLAMEPAHLKRLRMVPPGGCQLTLLGLWGKRRRPHIEDPYGLSLDYFRTCIGLIDEAVVEVAGRLGVVGAIVDDSGRGTPRPAEVRRH